jgi:hypothetical protein
VHEILLLHARGNYKRRITALSFCLRNRGAVNFPAQVVNFCESTRSMFSALKLYQRGVEKETTMRLFNLSSLLLAGAMAVLISAPASANGGHGRHGHFHHRAHIGVFIGAPLFWYPHYAAPYYRYAYPPVVVAPSGPTTYIEQAVETPPPAEAYWYYCQDSKTYYPYVKECPGGWQRVAPQPPPN